MRISGQNSSVFSFFLGINPSEAIIYRENCGNTFDRMEARSVGKSYNCIPICCLFRPINQRQIVQDSGADRARGEAKIFSKHPIYTLDQRDGLGADIIFVKGSYWKVMSVNGECGKYEARLELMPEGTCTGFDAMCEDVVKPC